MKDKFLYLIRIFVVLFSFSSIPVTGQTTPWQVGEELNYGVRWGFIRLGTLKFKVLEKTTYNEQAAYRISLHIDSSPYVFFVSMHYYYESYVNEEFLPLYFFGDEIDGSQRVRYKYFFNHQEKKILTEVSAPNDTVNYTQKEYPMPEPAQDGMSLVCFARANLYQTKTQKVLAYYNLKYGDVIINFLNNRTSLEIDAFEEPIEATQLHGTTTIKAIAGFSGAYRGWFSTDGRAIPLRAQMKVFVGSVTVDIEEWKNWNSPVPKRDPSSD